jgi:hypothetical protein
MSAFIIILAAAVSAVLALAYQHDWGGDATLWYCLLFAWVTAVAAGLLGHVPVLTRRQ